MIYAKYLGKDIIVEGVVLLKTGDVRKVHMQDYDQYLLEGPSNSGRYVGWILKDNLQLLESI